MTKENKSTKKRANEDYRVSQLKEANIVQYNIPSNWHNLHFIKSR